jgi:hypothetical protein
MFWFAVAYPLSMGPAVYLVGRGVLPKGATSALYAPVIVAARTVEPPGGPFKRYVHRWERAGRGLKADGAPIRGIVLPNHPGPPTRPASN